MIKFIKHFAFAVILFTLSACSTTPIVLKETFWENKQIKIGVAVANYPEAGAFKEGSQGLLDMAVNAALANDMQKYLKTLYPAEIDSVSDLFVENLKEKGFTVIKVDNYVNLKDYPKSGAGSSKSEYQFSYLQKKEKIDYLLLLQVTRFGTIRSYYGMIPLGSPKAICEVKGELINLSNNELLWKGFLEEDKATVSVAGNWDQSPDYPNLTVAVRKAVSRAATHLQNDFFNAKNKSTK